MAYGGRIQPGLVVIAGVDADGNIVIARVSQSGTITATVAPGAITPIVPFASDPTMVSVLTPLIALTPPGSAYHSLLFAIDATASTKAITLFIDVASDGTHTEAANQQVFSCNAGQANSLEIGPFPSRPYWALSAQSSDFSVQPVKFAWFGAG